MNAMLAVVSMVFQMIKFPLDGKFITIDQLAFHHLELVASSSTILLAETAPDNIESVGEGLFKDSSLFGLFPFPH